MQAIETDPDVQALLANATPRASQPLARREWASEAVSALVLVACTAALVAVRPPQHLHPATLGFLLIVYAAAKRVRFSIGAGTTSPIQPVLVTALLLLASPALAPALVVAGSLLARAPDYLRRRLHPNHTLLAFGDAWHAVGAAAVLVAAAPGPPALRHWPVYLAALGAQFLLDAVSGVVREWLASGVTPQLQVRLLLLVFGVDLSLAPLGLLAAIVGHRDPAAILLLLPMVALLAVMGQERERRIQHTLELSHAYRGTALLVSEMLEADDPYTGGEHSEGVLALALTLGQELGLDARDQRDLEFAALLHDVGKLRTPNEIINKPGPLDDDEWEIIRRHPIDGQVMLQRVGGVLADVGLIVRSHHERWDGGGYPDGLKGEKIPLAARIISACDAFNAMTTRRSYRDPMPVELALTEMAACSGTQFDPRVVRALTAVVERSAPPRLATALAA